MPEKSLWKAGTEWKCVFHHNFFLKPKQFIEAIPSMKKAHNEDVQRLGEITNSLEEIKFKLTKLKKGLGKKKDGVTQRSPRENRPSRKPNRNTGDRNEARKKGVRMVE